MTMVVNPEDESLLQPLKDRTSPVSRIAPKQWRLNMKVSWRFK
jgi:hypothetical protein